jgi:membrane fusion protein (multidrug efflux system)
MTRRLLALRDLTSAEAACLLSIRDLTGCERAYSWFYDAETGTLWSETNTDPSRATEHRATHGLTGLCARIGTSVCLTHASAHAGYTALIDDPVGHGDEHLLIQPVIGSDGYVLAVFTAVRGASQAPFSALEHAVLGAFSEQASPLLEQLGLQLEAEALLKPQSHATIFREEALEAYAVHRHNADVIRVSPRWSDWAYWVIVAFVAVSVGFAAIAHMARYSTGPAVVRVANRSAVTAHMSATVAAVEVTSGQRIKAGQRLARFYDAEQKATVELLDHEFATQLRLHMLEPSHQAAEQAVHTLRLDLDRARAALQDRTVRARHAGIVSDIRVRPGQSVAPGDVVMSIIDDESDLYVEAFLPGDARPKLAPGMPLRLEMNGYRYAYQTLSIDAVSTGVIGPSEARRFLGSQISDVVSITGPVVLVRARLTGRQFEADGHRYLYHDGMQATAEVQLRSQRLLAALVPSLERW